METREEIVSKLELIRENILGFIQARSRQVTLVNQMRTAKLIQQDEYNDNTLSHKSLKLAFSIMVFSSIAILLGDLLYVILLGAVNRLIGDIIFEVLFLSGFLFLLYRRMKGSKDSWIYPATLIMGGILLVFPLRLLLTPNPITLILLGVSIVATYFIIQNKLELTTPTAIKTTTVTPGAITPVAPQVKQANTKELPSTGETTSALGLMGVAMAALGLAGLKRKRESK